MNLSDAIEWLAVALMRLLQVGAVVGLAVYAIKVIA